MRIITKKRIHDFIKQYPDSKASLKFWYDFISDNAFYNPHEIIQVFQTADYVGNERIVFNIAKNKYRLIAKFKFHPKAQMVYLRFLGTHSDYDNIKNIKRHIKFKK